MKIHTLGTAHGDSTISRFNSSTAYETDSGVIYMVDAGAPAEALLRRKGLRVQDVRAVFITHMHDDHAGGLPGLMKQTTKYPKDRAFPLTVHLPEEKAIAALKGWFAAVHENPDNSWLEYKTADVGEVYDDENLHVTGIRTEHLRTRGRTEGDPCSLAYVLYFKKENKTILHTGDLRSDFKDFPAISAEKHFDICLCEATHYQPADSMEALMKAKFDRLLFIHIANRWHNMVGHSWDVECGEKKLLSHYTELPYPVAIAHDGDTFWL